jgi:outer membrane murein-binding lipoprotein Lpp
LTRTLRLAAGDAVSAAQKLSTEIRRTVVLAPADAASGESVAGIFLFGRDDDHQELAERIESETSLEVRRFDPFDAVGAATADVPANSGRFAALLGMLADEAAGTAHAIDLLHPRRPPRAQSRRRPMVLIVGAAVLAVCIAGGIAWSDLSQVEATNTNLNKELKELDTEIKRLDKSQQLASAIDDWERGGINWLDELKELSVRFPSSRDAVVQRMSMSPSRGGGGVITLQGQAREPAVVEKIGMNIRDPNHEIQTPRVQERLQEKSYTWHFETSIYVTSDSSTSPKKESERVAGSPAETSASSDASETTDGSSRSAKAAVHP